MTGQQGQEEEQTLQLSELWALVWDHKWWYIFCILAALFLAGFYIYRTPKTYSRTEKIIMDEDSQAAMMRDLTAFSAAASSFVRASTVFCLAARADCRLSNSLA